MRPIDIHASDIHSWAEEKLNKQLPLPAKPKYEVDEYDLPEDPSEVTNIELGQRMSWFASWFGYTQRLMGLAESEFVLVEAEYKLQIHTRGVELRKKHGRISADVVEAMVLGEDGDLTELYKRYLELLTIKTQLDSRLKIFQAAYGALSRELSRRELEARLQGG